MDISGTVAVVTGAASGIGRATALALVDGGASVVVADIDRAGGEETVALAIDRAAAPPTPSAGGGPGPDRPAAVFEPCDVTEIASLEALFSATRDRFGGFDILHNNAGIVCGEPLWPATSPATLLRQVTVNLGAVVVGTRLAVDHLAARGGGAIVNTASIGALLPLADEPAYSATKAGVVMFTRACAGLRTSHNVRVNAVLPGLTRTALLAKSGDGVHPAAWADLAKELMPLLEPEDVAAAVLDLITDDDMAGEHRIVGELPEFVRAML